MPRKKAEKYFKQGFAKGLGWALGVTIGFALISMLLGFLFSTINGLPIIGGWIADLIEETNNQLLTRTPGFK